MYNVPFLIIGPDQDEEIIQPITVPLSVFQLQQTSQNTEAQFHLFKPLSQTNSQLSFLMKAQDMSSSFATDITKISGG
jgi:hypothetical protein